MLTSCWGPPCRPHRYPEEGGAVKGWTPNCLWLQVSGSPQCLQRAARVAWPRATGPLGTSASDRPPAGRASLWEQNVEQLSGPSPASPRPGQHPAEERHYATSLSCKERGTTQAWRLAPEEKPLSCPLKGPESSQGPLLPARASEPNPEPRSRVCSPQYHRNKGVSQGSSGSEVNPASTEASEVPEDPGLPKSPASATGDRGRLRSPR